MSIVDPGGGSGPISGGVIDIILGGQPVIAVTGVGVRLDYNSKSISLAKLPYEFRLNPRTPKVINTTLTGVVETLRKPRIDVIVYVRFRPINNDATCHELNNFWQYVQQGNTFQLAFDDNKTKQTITTAANAQGTNVIAVGDASGVTVNNYYVLRGGPNYQIVKVAGVSAPNITIVGSLNFNFPSGSVFRDIYCWSGQLREENHDSALKPVLDYPNSVAGNYPNSWELEFEFYENLVWGA